MLLGRFPFELPALCDERFEFIYSGNVSRLLDHLGRADIDSDARDALHNVLCPPDRRFTLDDLRRHPYLALQQPPPA